MTQPRIFRILLFSAIFILVFILGTNLFRLYKASRNQEFEQKVMRSLTRQDAGDLKRLLDHGLNVNWKSSNGESLLRIAVDLNNTDCAKLLLDRGAKIQDSRWSRPLLPDAAADKLSGSAHHVSGAEIVRMLLDRGASVQEGYANGITPLHQAAEADSPDTAAVLLARGADINRSDQYGQTPLMYAVRENSVKMVPFLLAHGASVNARTKVNTRDAAQAHQETALSLAMEYHPEFTAMLRKAGARK